MDNGAGFPSVTTDALARSSALTSPFAVLSVTALAPSAARYQRKLTGYSSRSQVLFFVIICCAFRFVNDFFPANYEGFFLPVALSPYFKNMTWRG